MSSIEEDIKILESMLEEYENCSVPEIDMQVDVTFGKKQANAIKTLLGNLEALCDMQRSADRELKRQKQINEEHQKLNGELREKVKELEKESKILEFQNKQIENYAEELKKYNKTVSDRIVEYKKNSIPKQVVKDKIEELMIQGNYKTFYNPNGRTHFLKEESDCKIEVLQELLEGEKNNENIKS